MFYELVTLNLTLTGAAEAPDAATSYARAPEAGGELIGCWLSDIGPVNKLVLLRGFESATALLEERLRIRRSTNPFNCDGLIHSVDLQGFAPIQGFESVKPGRHGSFYEIRSYRIRPGGLAHLVPEWEVAAPERSRVSELLLAMFSLDGQDRLVHIWPYETLEQRGDARKRAVHECSNWPAASGYDWVDATDMQSGTYLPVAGSPLC